MAVMASQITSLTIAVIRTFRLSDWQYCSLPVRYIPVGMCIYTCMLGRFPYEQQIYHHRPGTHTTALDYYEIFMLTSMLVNKKVQPWHLTGWRLTRQAIKSHIRKSMLTNIHFDMHFT